MIDMQKLKEDIKSSAANKDKILFFKDGTKYRVRFLVELMKGHEIKWHSKYSKDDSVDCPCQEEYGRDCLYCDDEYVKTKSKYCWSVFEYESGKEKLLLFAANRCSPVPALMEFYNAYGTICDRDYEIKQIGSGTSKTFSVVPMDKHVFKNNKIKPLSESAVLKYIDKAFPAKYEHESGKERYDEAEENFMNEPKNSEEDDWGDDEGQSYESMKPQELYKLCKERNIRCETRKTKQYYIDFLTQYDNENSEEDDWGDDEEEEERELPFR